MRIFCCPRLVPTEPLAADVMRSLESRYAQRFVMKSGGQVASRSVKVEVKHILSLSVTLFATAMTLQSHGADLRDQDRQFLEHYESVRASLADDDLEGARKAASRILERPAALTISRADSLNTARIGFKKLSIDAIAIGRVQSGYLVFRCPMVDAEWLQRHRKSSNPYLGQKMPTCGQVK